MDYEYKSIDEIQAELDEHLRQRHLDKSNIPNDYKVEHNLNPDVNDLEAFESLKKIKDNIVEWVHGGFNVYISSVNCGNGKTAWATKLGLAYINQLDCKYGHDIPVYFINLSAYEVLIKSAINNPEDASKLIEVNKNIKEAKIVIWDDFSIIGNSSAYVTSYLYDGLNYRLNNNLSNIFTSNLPLNELKNYVEGRIVDRVGGYSDEITFKGISCRNKKFFK